MNNVKNRYLNSVNLNSNTSFPYLVLNVINDNAYPRNPGFHVMHWHEDLQFIYVFDGEIQVKTLEDEICVHQGEGVFINKEVVHYVGKRQSCHYNSFLFPEYFLEFYGGSPAKAFVEQITKNDDVKICHFIQGDSQGKELRSVNIQVFQNRNQINIFLLRLLIMSLSLLK